MQKFSIGTGNLQAAHCAMVEGVDWIGPPRSDVVPIGTVEWTRWYATVLGVSLPYLRSYPESLSPWMQRSVRTTIFAEASCGEFVKPHRLKAFTGGIKGRLDEWVNPSELVWACKPVQWVAEWRCYVLHGEIVGVSQYGDGDDRALDLETPRRMVEAFVEAPAGYSLDVGLRADGRIALVEVNDGWALGYYKDCPRRKYLDVIAARWRQIVEQARKA